MGLIAVIMSWYLFEIAVLVLGWEIERLQWWFTTESFPALSPGLFLAIISHAPPPQSAHLLSNVIGLWLFAGESEQHMTKLEVGVFFMVTSWLSVLAGTVVLGQNTMGASAGVLAFLGFYCIHLFLEHREKLELHHFNFTTATGASLRAYMGLFLVLTPIVIIPYLLGQLAGIIPAGNSDMVGHLTGFLCGMIYAYLGTV
jgi:membrane associated rhomboid family serine protease